MSSIDSIALHLYRPKPTGDYVLALHLVTNGEPEPKPVATETVGAGLFATGAKLSPKDVLQRLAQETADSLWFADIGGELYGVLHTGEVGEEWDRLRNKRKKDRAKWNALSAQQRETVPEPKGYRVFLAVEDPNIRSLPWEMAKDPADSLSFGLGVENGGPFVRCRSLDEIIPRSDNDQLGVHVLVVIAISPTDKDIAADRELWKIHATLGKAGHCFCIEVMDCREELCTPEKLRQRFIDSRPQIFHFIGHAESNGNQSALRLWNKDTEAPEDWSAAQVRAAISDSQPTLRFAYLNACSTGVGVTSSVAEAFLQAGTLGVIATQADVKGEAAWRCAEVFYSAIAQGITLDVACQQARNALVQSFPNQREPYLPMLMVQALPEHILFWPYTQKQIDAIEGFADWKEVRKEFVGRSPERRVILRALFGGNEQRYSALLLQGSRSAGKSWLTHWILQACAAHGFPVHRVSARNCRDWVHFVRWVAEGEPPTRGRLPTPGLKADVYAQLLDGLRKLAFGDQAGVSKDWPTRIEIERAGDDKVQSALKLFYQCLKDSALPDQPLVLVIDDWDFGSTEPNMSTYWGILKEYLGEEIAKDTKGLVRIAVVFPSDTPKTILDLGYANWLGRDLKDFPPSEVPRLLREFFNRRTLDGNPGALATQMFAVPPLEPVQGGELKELFLTLEKYELKPKR